ncbi:MAG: hypothetical protein LLG14_27550 [Nocardiaceae bacterium]|nr:hypothetical protein [Nocardiaceae bacterium]
MQRMTPEDTAIFVTGPMSRLRMRRDDAADYRAMLAREAMGRKFADCYERPAQWVTRRAVAEITAAIHAN